MDRKAMPKISIRKVAEISSHGAGGRLRCDDPPRDLLREEPDLPVERLPVLLPELPRPELLRFEEEVRLTVLRLAIAQMFSSS